ncbi:MAG: hypothetical protein RLO17_23780 [Cyclobacteriaceae bacterium]
MINHLSYAYVASVTVCSRVCPYYLVDACLAYLLIQQFSLDLV